MSNTESTSHGPTQTTGERPTSERPAGERPEASHGGRPGARPSDLPEPSPVLNEGWHCTHLFYRFDRAALSQMSAEERRIGAAAFIEAVDPQRADAPKRLQSFLISGHKADFGLIMFDADPLKIDSVHQAVLAGPLGPAIEPFTRLFRSLRSPNTFHRQSSMPSGLRRAAKIETRPLLRPR